MNELRQTKEYKLSDCGGEYTVPYKGADPVQVVLAQQIEELTPKNHENLRGFIEDQEAAKQMAEMDPSKYDGDIHQVNLDKAAAEGSKEFWPEDSKDKRNAYHKQHIERDYVEEAKIEIVDKVTQHFQDMLFEMICEEMGNRCVFQSQNYLTAEGHELFEEEFFDFYHEHHGEIMFEVMKNITN